MSETVLSALCGICHTEPPKYRCPRCGARTCSLPCIQKHKARADCDGLRNPRAFLPLAQLKTDAGIDHDFNFLSSIERARQRAEKDVVEARHLLSEKELHPPDDTKLFQKVWYGDELHHLPAQAQGYKRHGRPPQDGGPSFIAAFDKHVRRRLRYLDIEAVTMPKGMARQRENKTAWNRRTQTINWQVEWLIYHASELGVPSPADHQDQHQYQHQHQEPQPLRILYKSLEGIPLATALASTLDWHRAQHSTPNTNPPTKKKQQPQLQFSPPTQNHQTTAWPAHPTTSQNPLTTAWSQTTTAPHAETTIEERLAGGWRFFLVQQPTAAAARQTEGNNNNNNNTEGSVKDINRIRTGKKGVLVPLGSGAVETLTSALRGRGVVEFPAVVVLPGGNDNKGGVVVPGGYVLGDAGGRRMKRECVDGERVGGGGGGGEDDERDSGNGESRKKRAFDGASRQQGWSGRGQRGGGGGNARGGGKRARFERSVPSRPQPPPPRFEAEVEAEEGEVDSDGCERDVMDVDRGGMVVEDAGDESATLDGEEEGEVGRRGTRGGGLVDYGSDESD